MCVCRPGAGLTVGPRIQGPRSCLFAPHKVQGHPARSTCFPAPPCITLPLVIQPPLPLWRPEHTVHGSSRCHPLPLPLFPPALLLGLPALFMPHLPLESVGSTALSHSPWTFPSRQADTIQCCLVKCLPFCLRGGFGSPLYPSDWPPSPVAGAATICAMELNRNYSRKRGGGREGRSAALMCLYPPTPLREKAISEPGPQPLDGTGARGHGQGARRPSGALHLELLTSGNSSSPRRPYSLPLPLPK